MTSPNFICLYGNDINILNLLKMFCIIHHSLFQKNIGQNIFLELGSHVWFQRSGAVSALGYKVASD